MLSKKKKKKTGKKACYASNTIQEDESLIVLLIIETTRCYTRSRLEANIIKVRSNDREKSFVTFFSSTSSLSP